MKIEKIEKHFLNVSKDCIINVYLNDTRGIIELKDNSSDYSIILLEKDFEYLAKKIARARKSQIGKEAYRRRKEK